MYEEAFFHLLNTLHARHKLDAVAVAGGCGMNSVANGKIKLNTPFKEVYVQSAAGDAGGAIGAAMVVWHRVNLGNSRVQCVRSPIAHHRYQHSLRAYIGYVFRTTRYAFLFLLTGVQRFRQCGLGCWA